MSMYKKGIYKISIYLRWKLEAIPVEDSPKYSFGQTVSLQQEKPLCVCLIASQTIFNYQNTIQVI